MDIKKFLKSKESTAEKNVCGFLNIFPKTIHQIISKNITFSLESKYRKSKCQVFYAPMDVQLGNNVTQPDIFIICDESKITEEKIIGAPDLIVEIISPSTAKKDLNDKLTLYEEFKVPEYWIVFPKEELIWKYQFDDSKNKYLEPTEYFSKDDFIQYKDLEIKIEDIFN